MEAEEKIHRVDPPNCGCTDCMTGYSKPINSCNYEELILLHLGKLDNSSGVKVKLRIEVEYDF